MPRHQLIDTILGIVPKDRIWRVCENCGIEMGLYEPYLPITATVTCTKCKHTITIDEFLNSAYTKESKPKMGNTNYDEDEFEHEFDVMNPNPYRYYFAPGGAYAESTKIIVESMYKELDHIHKTLAIHQEVGNKLRENIAHERKTTIEKLGASNTRMQQQISGITANFSEVLSKLREELLALMSTKNTEAHTAIAQLDTSLAHKLNIIDSTLAQVLKTLNPTDLQRTVELDRETFEPKHYQKAIEAFAKEAFMGNYEDSQCEDDDDHLIFWKDDGIRYQASVGTIFSINKDKLEEYRNGK